MEEDESQLDPSMMTLDMDTLEDGTIDQEFSLECESDADGVGRVDSPSMLGDRYATLDESLTHITFDENLHASGGGRGGSVDDMSQISFDSATYAATRHGTSQWELLMKIADARRLPSDMSLSVAESSFSLKEREELETKRGEMQFEIDSLKERIKRRNVLIGTIREAYLKDVIELKTVMFSVLTESERLRVVSQWEANIPSLDLRKPIELCAPTEAEFTHTPCVTCGGQVEIFHRQSSRMLKLQKTLQEYKKKQEELLSENSVKRSMIDTNEMALKEVKKLHDDEKAFVYSELKAVKGQVEGMEKEINTLRIKNRSLYGENTALKEDNRDFMVVKEELRIAEREIFKQKTNNDLLSERLLKYEEKIGDLEQEADLVRQESVDILKKFNDEKEVTIQLKGDLRATNDTLSQWKQRHMQISDELKASQEDVARLNDTIVFLNEEMDKFKLTMKSEIDVKDKTIGILKDDVNNRCMEIELWTERFHFENWLLDGCRMNVEDLTGRVSSLEDIVADLEADVDERDGDIEDLRDYIKNMMSGGSDQSNIVSQSSRDGGELSQREISMVKGLKEMQGKIVNLTTQYKAVMQQVQAQQATISTQGSTILAYHQQLVAMQMAMQQMAQQSSVPTADGVAPSQHTNFAEQQAIQQRTNQLSYDLDAAQKQISSLEYTKSILHSEGQATQEKLMALRSEFNSYKDICDRALAEKAGDVSDVYKEQLIRLEGLLAAKTSEAEQISTSAAQLQGQLASNAAELKAVSRKLEIAENEKANSIGLADLKRKQASLENSTKLEQERSSRLDADLAAANQKIGEILNKQSYLMAELEAEQAKFMQLRQEYDTYKVSMDQAMTEKNGDMHSVYKEQILRLEGQVVDKTKEAETNLRRVFERDGLLAEASEREKEINRQLQDTKNKIKLLEESPSYQMPQLQNFPGFPSFQIPENAPNLLSASSIPMMPFDSSLLGGAGGFPVGVDQSAPPSSSGFGEIMCSKCREQIDLLDDSSAMDLSQWDFLMDGESSGGDGRASRSRGGTSSRRSKRSGGSRGTSRGASSIEDLPATPAAPMERKAAKTILEVVEVIPPSEDATLEELALRAELYQRLIDTIGPITAKKAINGIAEIVSKLGSLLNISHRSQWDWAVFARQMGCMYPVYIGVLENMVRCVREGHDDRDVGVAVRKSEMVLDIDTVWNSGWVAACGVDATLSDLLNPKSGTVADYSEVFGEHIITDRLIFVERLEKALPPLREYIDSSVGPLIESMSEVLKDWSVGKNLQYVVDSMVETAQKKEKQIGDKKIADLQKELQAMKRKLDVIKQEKSKTDKRSDKLVNEIEALRFVEAELKREKDKNEILSQKIAEYMKTGEQLGDKIDELERKGASLLTDLVSKTMALDNKTLEAKAFQERCTVQEEMVAKEFHEKAVIKIALKEIEDKEAARIAGQRIASTQCTIETSCASIQTEFIPTDRSLRTTMMELADKQPELAPAPLAQRKKFPIAISAPVSLLNQAIERPVFGHVGSASKPSPRLTTQMPASDVQRIADLTKEFAIAARNTANFDTLAVEKQLSRSLEAKKQSSTKPTDRIDHKSSISERAIMKQQLHKITPQKLKSSIQPLTAEGSAGDQSSMSSVNVPMPHTPPPPQQFFVDTGVISSSAMLSPVIRGYQDVRGEIVRRSIENGIGTGNVRSMSTLAMVLSPPERIRLSASVDDGANNILNTPSILQPRKKVLSLRRTLTDSGGGHNNMYDDSTGRVNTANTVQSALSLGSWAHEQDQGDSDYKSINDDVSIGSAGSGLGFHS